MAGAESLETGDIEAAMGALRAALAIVLQAESFQHTQDEPLSTETQWALADARRARRRRWWWWCHKRTGRECNVAGEHVPSPTVHIHIGIGP